jgi:hypothetical protein
MKLETLAPRDYPRLKKFFANQKYRLCAYSLPSILVWSSELYQPIGAVVDDSMVVGVHFTRKNKRNHLILPVSLGNDRDPEQLARLSEQTGIDQYFFVPEQYIRDWGIKRVEEYFEMTEQTAFEDYVYATRDLSKLEGNKYSKKRNLINQFRREYVARKRVRLEPITAAVADECLEFLEEWCRERDCGMESDEELYCEKKAAQNAIRNVETLEICGLLLRIDGKVSAFGMATRLTGDMGVFHFEKAFSKFKGLYQYFDNQCAKKLFKGFKYINKESDMDLPGLEKAKKSYYPAMMVKSFRLVLR